MISLIIIGLCVMSYFFARYAHIYALSDSIIDILGIYLVCVLIDAILQLFTLVRAVKNCNDARFKYHPITYLGRIFSENLEILILRLNLLNDAKESKEDLNPLIPEPTLSSEEHFFDQTLSEIEMAFKPLICAILYKKPNEAENVVILNGIKGQRIKALLNGFFCDFFRSDNLSSLGVQDTFEYGLRGEEISVYGIRYLISASFNQENTKGVLVLGFSSSKKPSVYFSDKLSEYTLRLERELATFQNFRKLKDQVVQAEQKSEARTEFLTHVSHDIKSPLNNVRTILHLIKEDLKDFAGLKELLETGLRNCDSVSELVDSLIDFAKFRLGKLTARKTLFSLKELSTEVIENFEFFASAKGLKIELKICDELKLCKADKGQVKRILCNLLNNAIKYTEYGNIKLSISIQEQNYYRLSVIDNGKGFSESQLKELFTPFTRFDNSNLEGAGLGLMLSKILAELNGGELQVKSALGGGSEFIVLIPCADAQIDTENKSCFALQKNNDFSIDGIKVLIVDDDIDLTQSLARILKNNGADVSQANTILDATSIINFFSPDILITDVNMPEGGASELLNFVKIRSPRTVSIVVSGDISNEDQYLSFGAACVLPKPLQIKELIEYIQEVDRYQELTVVQNS